MRNQRLYMLEQPITFRDTMANRIQGTMAIAGSIHLVRKMSRENIERAG